jgi:hypothetical protein
MEKFRPRAGFLIHKVFLLRIFSKIFLRDKERQPSKRMTSDLSVPVEDEIRIICWSSLFLMLTFHSEDSHLPTPPFFLKIFCKKV